MRPARALFVSLLAFGVLGAMTARADGATVEVPSSIDASGGRDVTADLNAFFAKVTPGTTVEFPANARYRAEGIVQIESLQNVTISGNGSTLIAHTDGSGGSPPEKRYRSHWPRLRQHLSVLQSSGVTIRDLAIEGPNGGGKYVPALEGQAAIAVAASSKVEIDRVSVRGVYGDGVYVAAKTSDVRIHDSSFDSVGRQGVAVVDGATVTVERNRFDHVGRSVVDLEPVPRSSAEHIYIRDNDVGSYGNFLLAAGGAGTGVNDVWLQRNHVTGGSGLAVFAGMERWLRHGLHIVGNRSEAVGRRVAGASRGGVMQIAGIDGVEIVDNEQPVASGTVAITLTRVCNAVVRDNRFPGASQIQRSTGSCDAVPIKTPTQKASGSGRTSPTTGHPTTDVPSRRADAARPPSTRSTSSTDSGWLVAGAVTGAAVLAMLGVLAWRRSRRLRT
jgi:hypothetical protein